jgi:membrane protease YdiL (CAAX protease family)
MAEETTLSVWKTVQATSLVLSCALLGRLLGILGIGMLSGRLDPFAENAAQQVDGVLLAMGILGASLFGGFALLVALREHAPLRYLALDTWSTRHFAWGLLASIALVLVFNAARFVLTGSVVPALWQNTYRSAESIPLLALALCEESLFRGLLHRGLVSSKLGEIGTIAIISILFALAHRPTDLLSALDPLASGILLGVVRQQSASTRVCVVMHAFMNLQAILTVMLVGVRA